MVCTFVLTNEAHPGDAPGARVDPKRADRASLQVVMRTVVEVDRLNVTDLEGLVIIRERDGGHPVRIRSRDVNVIAVMVIEEHGIRTGSTIDRIATM